MCVCLPAYDKSERGGEHQTENDTETIDTKPFKIWFNSAHGITLGKSAACEETLSAEIAKTVLYSAWCRCPGDGCSGEHSANGSQHTGFASVMPYSLSDLKYSSQRSCLSINIYFNKRYTQSAHGALGMHVTFTVVGSFRLKMATKNKTYRICNSYGIMRYSRYRTIFTLVFM